YERDGYFVVPQTLSSDDVIAVRSAIHRALAAPEEKRVGNYDPELKQARQFRKLGQFARHDRDVFHRAIAHENVLAVMHHFLGPDLVMVYDSVFLKLARTGGATPWHQDIGLWPEKMHGSFNFWIAIDPANKS